MPEDPTPVVEFIAIAWKHAGGDPHSWVDFNRRIRIAAHIAAEGFPWRKGDIDELVKLGSWRGRIDRCLGECGFEGIYTSAVTSHNVSAYTEIERYINRTPIIADNVNKRQRDRLCVGSRFSWNGEEVRVTSFNKHDKAICCSYSWTEKDGCVESSLKHRYIIGPEDIKKNRKMKKKGTSCPSTS